MHLLPFRDTLDMRSVHSDGESNFTLRARAFCSVLTYLQGGHAAGGGHRRARTCLLRPHVLTRGTRRGGGHRRARTCSVHTYEGDAPRGAGMDGSVSEYGGLSGGRYGDGWASLVDALSTNKIKQLPQQPTHQKNGECCDGEKMRNPSGSRMDPCTSGGVSLPHEDLPHHK